MYVLNVLNNVSKAPFYGLLLRNTYMNQATYNIISAQTYFMQFVSCMSWSKGPMQPRVC